MEILAFHFDMDNNFNYSAVKSYHQTTEFIFLLLLCLTSADCFRNLKVVENRFSKQRKSINYIRNTFYSKSNLVFTDCYVGFFGCTRKNAHDYCYYFWRTFIAVQLAL